MSSHAADTRRAAWAPRHRWRAPKAIRVLARDRVGTAAGVVALAIMLSGLCAPVLAQYDPNVPAPDSRLEPPSATHWFGTDELGRDLFARVLYGARISLEVGVITVALAVALGSLVGLVTGYFGGLVDQVLMRVTDIFLAFPGLLLAMAFAAALGPSIQNAAIALGLVYWPGYARLMRGQVMTVRQALYVESARASGASAARVLVRHVLPSAFDPVGVRATMTGGYAILMGASLSFIGLGAQPPTPEWGLMVAVSRAYLLSAWWYPTLVGAAIFVTILAITMAGDAIQDALDPKLRRSI
jgi:peptide/nickel transport system permease protein